MKLRYVIGYLVVGLLYIWLFAGWAIAATIAFYYGNEPALITTIWWIATWICALFLGYMLERNKKIKE